MNVRISYLPVFRRIYVYFHCPHTDYRIKLTVWSLQASQLEVEEECASTVKSLGLQH